MKSLTPYRLTTNKKHWSQLWSSELAYGQNLLNVINTFVYYPNNLVQSRVVACYLSLELQLLDKAFILYLFGESRSGKSTTGKLASVLTNSSVWSSNSTFASIRRYLEAQRYRQNKGVLLRDLESGDPIERNLFLIWDDHNELSLSNNQIYQFLKTSCDRLTAKDSLASSDDLKGTKEFSTFSLKIISSTFSPFKNPLFTELSNRCIYVRCERINADVEQIEQIEDWLWTDIGKTHDEAWNERNAIKFFETLHTLKKPKDFSLPQWEISRTLIASGITQSIFENSTEAIDCFLEHWQSLGELIQERSHLEIMLEHLIEEWANTRPNLRNYVVANFIADSVKARIKSGELPLNRYNAKEVYDAMKILGYELRLVNGVNVWSKN